MPSDPQLPAEARLADIQRNLPLDDGTLIDQYVFEVPVSSAESSLAERMAEHARTSREWVFHPEDDMGIWRAQAQKMVDELGLRSELEPGFPG